MIRALRNPGEMHLRSVLPDLPVQSYTAYTGFSFGCDFLFNKSTKRKVSPLISLCGLHLLIWDKLYTYALSYMIVFNPVFQPVAAGSGIPEIKCYLNGIKIPRGGAAQVPRIQGCGGCCSVFAGGTVVLNIEYTPCHDLTI
ncbi:hypothetical protein DPMN_159174 [Dreissena polymorpha]|uniref:Uncharacterized protein n=1 Tax=Dreissena polymorpha TaxID=45954 RepID=A0A9D4EJ89_DREPO|nr:hypothetical protein DPMN_159174 [Dreissena polymorpha]